MAPSRARGRWTSRGIVFPLDFGLEDLYAPVRFWTTYGMSSATVGLFIPCKSGNRLEPPSHYSVSICIILICNGCIPSWFRVTIDELPPSATFNHMRCDYTLRLIEVLRPLQPLWYSRKIGTVLSTTPSTSCRSIDHLTLLLCLVSHQAGLRVW